MNHSADHWYDAYCRAKSRRPHSVFTMLSIASSSPINTWYCKVCHDTELAIRPPLCYGGYPERTPVKPVGFGNRETNLVSLNGVSRYAKERGTLSALSHHRWFMRAYGRR